jgi:ABC-type lipoprotein release transport system permease subunit
MLTLSLAWRNLWRNRKRTVITTVAVALNTAVLIASAALMTGMVQQMTNTATEVVLGHAQLHAPGYRRERSLYATLPSPEALLAQARAAGIQAAPRSFGFGLVAVGHKSAGATFWGVQPAAERAAFKLAANVQTGQFLADSALDPASAVIGAKLARSLDAQVGTELVVVVQAADGSIGNAIFSVRGILRTVGDEIDRGAVLLHARDFESLFVAPGMVHEIALYAPDVPLQRLASTLGPLPAGAEYQTWQQLNPAFADMVKLTGSGIWIFAVVFYLAAALGVMNTMLMATHDRVREFGVQKALGATPGRILLDVAVEGWLMSLVATGIGAALGVAGSALLHRHGIDLTKLGGDISFGGIAFDPIWRAALRASDVAWSVTMMWVICVVASLYPALRAARLDPVRAMTDV